MIPIPNLLISWRVGWGTLVYNPRSCCSTETSIPLDWLFKCPFLFFLQPTTEFLGEKGTSLTPTGFLEISDKTIRSKEYRICASAFLSYHIRPGGTILAEQDFNIPVANELIFGGAVGLQTLSVFGNWVEILVTTKWLRLP